MQRLKVMEVTHDLAIGGLQRVVVDLARTLDKNEFDVSVCCLREGGIYETVLAEHDIRVIKIPASSKPVDYLCFWKIYQVLKLERPIIIHTHNTQPYIEGVVSALMAGVPVRIHTDHAREFPDKRRYMVAERILSHAVHQIIAVSDQTKNDLIKYERIDPDKITVVVNGIDGSMYRTPLDRKWKLIELGIPENGGPILGFCGRLSPEKGITFLLKAMRMLVEEFPRAILLIVGDGELKTELDHEIQDRNLNKNVMLLGERLDANEIMRILDVFILPSLREGLPLVLLEATAASVPIVATNVGGNRIVVDDGVNGFLVEPGKVEALSNALRKLMNDKVARQEFGRVGYDLFNRTFTLEQMVKNYETIYRKYAMLKNFAVKRTVSCGSLHLS
jgi:glycosyltransferase involved in cell wall biosynthesis